MVSVLLGIWAAFDFLLLAAGAVSISMSIVWKAPNVLMNMVLSPSDLTGISPVILTWSTEFLLLSSWDNIGCTFATHVCDINCRDHTA